MLQTERKGQYIEIVIPNNWYGLSIEHILRQHYQAPKKLLHAWRMEKDVLLNGSSLPWNTVLQKGDKLMLPVFKGEAELPEATFYEVDVLFEDDHLIIVNKPAGIDTHPSQPGKNDSLLNAVAYHLLMKGELCDLRHIHRLDKDTTGAIIFSKHAFAGAILQQSLEERTIKRTYKALVHGRLHKKNGTIKANIGRDRHHPTRRRISPTGQVAITHYKTLKYFPHKDLTLIECILDTGRTHQIRVHLSYIGHPLAGDLLYGGKPVCHRQALHAYKISLKHPISGELLEIEAPYIDTPSIFDNL